jgi:hypothetical protein
MAARRLVIVLLVMLAVSTIAAALVPAPSRDTGGTTATTRTAAATAPAPAAPAGALVHGALDAGAPQPGRIHVRLGDELTLLVRAAATDQVEIGGYGLVEPVARQAPAEFDLLVDEGGRFPVRLVDGRRLIGTIVVGPPRGRRSRAPAPGGSGSG